MPQKKSIGQLVDGYAFFQFLEKDKFGSQRQLGPMPVRDALAGRESCCLPLHLRTHAGAKLVCGGCRARAECARASERIKQVSVDRSIRVRKPQQLSSEPGIESNEEKPKFGTNNVNRGTNDLAVANSRRELPKVECEMVQSDAVLSSHELFTNP